MTKQSPVTDSLRSFLRADQIFDNELWREIYARDASYFDIKPLCMVRPETVEEVGRILAVASANGTSVTFRAGGTSLSGQTLGEGIVCELRTGWNRYDIRDNGSRIWFEPGLTVKQVNARLAPFHTHIGPDPASSKAAMMGGVLSNNSSGMEAGVKYNSYHTLASIEFMTARGRRYNTALRADRERFLRDEKELCDGLLGIRREIMASDAMRNKIVEKYKIKNVTGYAMNSFVDFDDPVDIFAHLLIGSEGTLAWIIAGELHTRPVFDVYSSSMLYFPDVTSAAASAAFLGETGAVAVEMMDYASLRSAQGLENDMPHGTTAMLIDYGAASPEEMEAMVAELTPKIHKIPKIIHQNEFTHTVAERARLWKIRDGIFPCVAGVRAPGSTVILEDVAASVEKLDSLVEGVQRLFVSHGYDGAIFGHARDGNIHPLVTTKIGSDADLSRFRSFMDGLVDHVVSLGGSLKGEHGTGRAIAPFVAKEWGDGIYALMKRVKRLADPGNVLNPGVMINDDPDCFIEPMKSLGLFGAELGYENADRCMECGYCEHCCPSRDITLTPRQRLQGRRIIENVKNPALRRLLEKQYAWAGRDSCCTDSSCKGACPMKINTGTVTDALRDRENPALFDKALTFSASHFGGVENMLRGALRFAVGLEKIVSPAPLNAMTDLANRLYKQVPHWSEYFPKPPRIEWREIGNADFVYFPACVTRIFGGSSVGKDDMITVMLRVAERAGLRVTMPEVLHGICCSQIWEHKGDPDGQKIAVNKTVEAFWKATEGGRIPLFCDTTSCTHTLLTLGEEKDLFTDVNRERFRRMHIMDITTWLIDHVMPRLKVASPKRNVVLHPTCASRLINVDNDMRRIAELCAERVTVPADSFCCGAAGDRGFIYPQVARSAVRDERAEIARNIAGSQSGIPGGAFPAASAGEELLVMPPLRQGTVGPEGRPAAASAHSPVDEPQTYDGYYSLARTCEISMMSAIGHPYESIIYLVDETTASRT